MAVTDWSSAHASATTRAHTHLSGGLMLVVKVYMWPGGDHAKERLLSVARLDLWGIARTNSQGCRQGERAYRVLLLKDVAAGAPNWDEHPERVLDPGERQVWRGGFIRGHMLGPRGGWDLLGGALRELLGHRLRDYVEPSDAHIERMLERRRDA